MKFGFAGAGAVGCHYGSKLQQAGIEVVLLARGAHLQALQNRGLTHESDGETRCVAVHATDRPEELADCDVVVLSCKMTTLDQMLSSLAGNIREDAAIVTLQNGVEAPHRVAAVFPRHEIIAGTAFIGARIEAPGHVIHSAAGGVRLAAWTAAKRLNDITAAFNKAGVPARAEPDARLMLWRKLLWNAGFNGITAITRRFARDIAANADTLEIVLACMRETVALAQAEGIKLQEQDIEKHIEITLSMGPVMTSMWQDIEAGRATEVDYINGFVARRSAELGLEASANRMLATLLRAIEGRL